MFDDLADIAGDLRSFVILRDGVAGGCLLFDAVDHFGWELEDPAGGHFAEVVVESDADSQPARRAEQVADDGEDAELAALLVVVLAAELRTDFRVDVHLDE